MDAQDERQPLLHEPAGGAVEERDPPPYTDCEAGVAQTTRRAFVIVVMAIAIVFIFDFAAQLIQSPLTRIYEGIICRNYYAIHDPLLYPVGRQIPESECKIPPVQSELAFVRGMGPVFDAIPSLLSAIPLGILADNPKIGRKPIILTALIASVAQTIWVLVVCWFSDTLPLRMVWLGSFFMVAGGAEVINAILYTMLIDITAPNERASTFFTLHLTGTWLPVLLAPPVTSALMVEKGNWVPVLIGLFLSFVGTSIAAFVPETINFRDQLPAKDPAQVEELGPVTPPSPPSPQPSPAVDALETGKLQQQFRDFIDSSSFVFHSPHLIILICSLTMHVISSFRAMDMVIYYASARYDISIAKANLLNTVNAGVSIGVLSFLPIASVFLTEQLKYTSQRKDLLIAQTSVTMFAIGWFGVGLAPELSLAVAGLVVVTLGTGFSGSVRSLAASYVEPHHQARLSSFIAVTMAAGNFVGSPLLAWLYGLGVSVGDRIWYGLPFMALGTSFVVIASALWFTVRLPEDGEPVIADEDES